MSDMQSAENSVRMPHGSAPTEPPPVELSIVMPCLNEADTLESCISKAQQALLEHHISGEIIVVDNGSLDGSQEIATRLGVHVIAVQAKGYGNALMGGISAAQGRYIIMGDADDSYDFTQIHLFVAKLREGYQLVQGCRLPKGGGTILPGAMPFLHRWLGNPLFSFLAQKWFHAPISDIYCGLRGFSKSHYESLNLRCTGMEFATEMIIKSSLHRAKMTQVPVILRPDGRKAHPPHLKTWRDGWRTLRFFLMYSPKWLFLLPGLWLFVLGLLGYVLVLGKFSIHGIILENHSLLFSSLFMLCGYQSILFAIFTKTFAISTGMQPEDPRMDRFFEIISLERGLLLGVGSMVAGIALLCIAIMQWVAVHFGHLDYTTTMRWVIPGATLTALGFQTILSSFFVSIIGMRRK